MSRYKHVSFELLEDRRLFSSFTGNMDESFGRDGVASTAFGFTANDIAVQPDGRTVIVGAKDSGFAVARLDADGTVDDTFGNHGMIETHFNDGPRGHRDAHAERVAIQRDGKIVVAGEVFVPDEGNGNTIFEVVRYNADGTLDHGFSHLFLPIHSFSSHGVSGLGIEPNGKIV